MNAASTILSAVHGQYHRHRQYAATRATLTQRTSVAATAAHMGPATAAPALVGGLSSSSSSSSNPVFTFRRWASIMPDREILALDKETSDKADTIHAEMRAWTRRFHVAELHRRSERAECEVEALTRKNQELARNLAEQETIKALRKVGYGVEKKVVGSIRVAWCVALVVSGWMAYITVCIVPTWRQALDRPAGKDLS